jgi:signal recognition particle subunit SRP19
MSSRELKGKKIIIWPVYIDSSKSISEGRKIPLKYAVKNPTLDEIVEAAKILNLNPIIERKSYPRLWWSERVCVIVDKIKSKRTTLIEIAETIKKLRESRHILK